MAARSAASRVAAVRENATLALLRAHLATGKATRTSCAVIYAVALANYASMRDSNVNHWSAFNTAIKEGLGLKTFKHLDAVKKDAWALYESTVERLKLPASAPHPIDDGEQL